MFLKVLATYNNNRCMHIQICTSWNDNTFLKSHTLSNRSPNTRFENPSFKLLVRNLQETQKPNRLLLYQVKINLFCWRYHPLCIKNLQNLYWNWPSILYSGELYSTRMWEMQATKREKQLIILSSCEAHEPQKWPSWQKLCKGTVVIFVSWKQLSKWTQGPLHRRESWLVL